MNKADISVGQRVHYIPFEGVDPSQYQNGRVKSLGEVDDTVFVVFNCNNEWDKYENYTAQSTRVKDLQPGWINQ